MRVKSTNLIIASAVWTIFLINNNEFIHIIHHNIFIDKIRNLTSFAQWRSPCFSPKTIASTTQGVIPHIYVFNIFPITINKASDTKSTTRTTQNIGNPYIPSTRDHSNAIITSCNVHTCDSYPISAIELPILIPFVSRLSLRVGISSFVKIMFPQPNILKCHCQLLIECNC